MVAEKRRARTTSPPPGAKEVVRKKLVVCGERSDVGNEKLYFEFSSEGGAATGEIGTTMTFIGYSWAFSAAVSNGVIDTMRKVSDEAEAVAFFHIHTPPRARALARPFQAPFTPIADLIFSARGHLRLAQLPATTPPPPSVSNPPSPLP